MSDSPPPAQSPNSPTNQGSEPAPPAGVAGPQASWVKVNRRTSLWWPWLACALIVVLLLATAGWVFADRRLRERPGPVVESFFGAIAERRVDDALALIADGWEAVPYGRSAAFLHPDAIGDDWRVVSVRQTVRTGQSATVAVRLGGPDGEVDTEFTLVRVGGGPWRLRSPLVEVELALSPLAYLQVNDRVVALDRVPSRPVERFWLFPGVYEFYPAAGGDKPSFFDGAGPSRGPLTLVPNSSAAPGQSTAFTLTPGRLTAASSVVDQVAHDLRVIIDDCAQDGTRQPLGCPFGADHRIDLADGGAVRNPEALTWSVQEYPEISLVNHRDEYEPWGFRVVADRPGTVTLSGRGSVTDSAGQSVRGFTVDCEILFGDRWYVRVAADGRAELTGHESLVREATCPREGYT